MCYECEGADCDKASMNSVLCLINSGQGCWTNMVETADGVKTHSRKCSNITCDAPDVEKCVPNGDDTKCSRCCNSNNCNKDDLNSAPGFLRGGFWVKVNIAIASLITYSVSVLL
ncbi:hypothetical protein NP493_1386g00035 [Ridgeia piscesae]|uniref:Uncharacterized protein n=1 Tax=Ridgeia piscesae TaxID=27915 RepID=A0AAD9K6I1_RIDPI|nr:hypothetical protein NP493_1386g00035 [Ridgeia piscesae]